MDVERSQKVPHIMIHMPQRTSKILLVRLTAKKKRDQKNQKMCESKWPTWQVVEIEKEDSEREKTQHSRIHTQNIEKL